MGWIGNLGFGGQIEEIFLIFEIIFCCIQIIFRASLRSSLDVTSRIPIRLGTQFAFMFITKSKPTAIQPVVFRTSSSHGCLKRS
jgi:hypothetical protein